MDEGTLNEVSRDAHRRRFWIVLWGDPEHSADDDVQIFDEPEYDQGLAKPETIGVGDILFVHRIHISKIIFVAEVIGAPR
jgi:hypothetical protein